MIEKLTFCSELVLRLICTGQLQYTLPSLKDIVYMGWFHKTKDLPYFEFLKSFSFLTKQTEDQFVPTNGE